LNVTSVKIKPKIESQTVKKMIKIKTKSIIGWFVSIEIKLEKKTRDKYRISKKKIPSKKDSEKAIPIQLLKNKKIEKKKIIAIFWLK